MDVMWFNGNCVMLKYDIVHVGDGCDVVQWQLCNAAVDTNDLELIDEISSKDTENVLASDVTYKQKCFLLGFLPTSLNKK